MVAPRAMRQAMTWLPLLIALLATQTLLVAAQQQGSSGSQSQASATPAASNSASGSARPSGSGSSNATSAPSSSGPIISQSLSVNGSRTVTYNVTVTPSTTPSTLPIATAITTGGAAGTALAPAPGVTQAGQAAGPSDSYIHNAAKSLFSSASGLGAFTAGAGVLLGTYLLL